MSNRIVVGVDGTVGSRSALLWAVDECRIRQRTLLIAHARGGPLVDGEHAVRALDRLGDRLLSEDTDVASARQPSVPVTSLLSQDPASDVLIELSADAELLVVGSHGQRGNLSSIGSVSHRVAAHAHCPVAVVPERSAFRRDTRAPRVVVGVSTTVAGRHALEFALDEAHRRAATLVAVYAWGEPGTSLVSAPLIERYPDLQIEPTLVTAEPADALLDEAKNAALVIVGCDRNDDRWSARLGPVPSAILHRSPCPVVVLHQRQEAVMAGAAACSSPTSPDRLSDALDRAVRPWP